MPFIISNDGGWFCPTCPVVVLDYEDFLEGVLAAGASQGTVFTVAGIVDWEAIPEEKSDEPIGEEDNPIPLVEFLNVEKERGSSPKRPSTTRKKRKKLKRLRKKKKRKK